MVTDACAMPGISVHQDERLVAIQQMLEHVVQWKDIPCLPLSFHAPIVWRAPRQMRVNQSQLCSVNTMLKPVSGLIWARDSASTILHA